MRDRTETEAMRETVRELIPLAAAEMRLGTLSRLEGIADALDWSLCDFETLEEYVTNQLARFKGGKR